MPRGSLHFRLALFGPFALEGPCGDRIAVTSKRSQALLGMLGTAPNGERTRRWLESTLWCDRPAEQAKASLRKELSNLRRLTASGEQALIEADSNSVRLNLDHVSVDAREGAPQPGEIFLEGLDIAGEEEFEDWLRAQRGEFAAMTHEPALIVAPSGSAETHRAIAVLPFRLVPPDAERDYAAFGLSEELINRLSRLCWLPVIAHSSSFALGTDAIDPRTAGLALGARYVVEGTLRPTGQTYRLAVGLSDADSGRSLWTDTITLASIEDLAAVDSALEGVTAALDHKVDQKEQQRALTMSTDAADVIELVWKARWHLNRFTDEDMAEAGGLLSVAEARDPASSNVLIEKAWLEVRKLWVSRGSPESIKGLRKMAQVAILADPDDARGHMIAGIAEFWLAQPLRAEALFDRAIELNPSLVMAHAQRGSCLHHIGRPGEAIAALETARRLSPNDFDLFFTEGELAMAHLAQGNFETAIDHADASLSRRAAYWSSHVAKIAALVALDRMPEAAQAWRELKEAQPGFEPHFIDWLPYADASRNEALQDGLNQAASFTD